MDQIASVYADDPVISRAASVLRDATGAILYKRIVNTSR